MFLFTSTTTKSTARAFIMATMMMVQVGLLTIVPQVHGKANQGYDLDHDAPIRIGIKKRAKDCKVKSKRGDLISVHYVGTLYKDGEEFDSSRKRNQPFDFKLGAGSVIKGWDTGLSNMCIGEVRQLTLASELAYGNAGSPPKIHAGATLVFQVELMDIKDDGDEDLDDFFNSYYGSLNDDEDLDYYEQSHFGL
mmetsp:Transcript_22519/g.26100  ORF Transcript_22519/g.26100 Transcript_22519/m.26100 type:complete len:193 (+) Transcript_22519:71-649(+)